MAFHLCPGPEDLSVLEMQDFHVSQHVWQGRPDRHLRVRRAHKFRHMDPDQRILPYLELAGFVGVAHMGYCTIDHSLITALVKRWRPETHTFHMPTGECTITLEDIAIISGLPIDGDVVTGRTSHPDWMQLCQTLLGSQPPESHVLGGRVDMSWLWSAFRTRLTPADEDDYVMRCARAYILRLIGGLLFPDHSGRYVHMMFLPLLEDFTDAGRYSWGSAVLTYLYRELCKVTDYSVHEIGGACVLLQYWAWHKFSPLVPTLVDDTDPVLVAAYVAARRALRPLGFRWHKHKVLTETPMGVLLYYRRFFDQMKNDEITWRPYTDEIVASLQAFCVAGRDIYLAVVPLIFFHIVEWHQPDKVMRQFGLDQPIPRRRHQPDELHSITLAGRHDVDWRATHLAHIAIWDTRRERCVVGWPLEAPLTAQSEYMRWYRRITRRWISRTGASIGFVADIAENVHASARNPSSGFSMASLQQSMEDILSSVREHDRITLDHLRPAPPADEIPGPSEQSDEQRPRRRRRGLASTRSRLRLPDDSGSSAVPSTQPPPTSTATYRPSEPSPPSYPPYPAYPPSTSYPPPTYPYPPYPYTFTLTPSFPYPPYTGYPPYPHPSQAGPSSDPHHRPPRPDPGPSH